MAEVLIILIVETVWEYAQYPVYQTIHLNVCVSEAKEMAHDHATQVQWPEFETSAST